MSSGRDYRAETDSDLVAQYKRSGDLTVFGELYNRYTALVYGVCLKYLKDRDDSKDAVMQIFEKLVTSLRDHEVLNFKSWLYTTARNYCLMQLRSKKSKNFQELSPVLMESNGAAHLEDEPETEINIVRLEKCIELLGEEQKQCVKLFYIQQKSYKEIILITGFEDSKVKSYIQNGKRNLKICMERND